MGAARHALGQNLAAYVRIPEEGLLVELYCDMEQIGPDHEPREWPDDVHSSNTWGILPPRSYFRFDAAAVEHERLGLEAQGHPLPPGDDSMASMSTERATGARTGEQFLDGLRAGGREIWLRGEKIANPLDHPDLHDAALSMARVFDVQHEHAGEMLVPSPADPSLPVNITHVIPRTPEDLVRRRRAIEIVAALSRRDDGPHARLPQRDVRLLRRRAPTCGRGAATSRARRTSSPTRSTCATTTSRRRTRS